MFDVAVNNNQIQFGKHFSLSFHRTVRVPDDGRSYKLPASLGKFPIYKVAEFINTVPFSWIQNGGGIFVPMYQFEALWIDFKYPNWRPHALKIGAGGVNIVNGALLTMEIKKGINDYLVCPSQPWIDGFNAGDGKVRQFIAVPLGSGLSAEAVVLGEEKKGGLQIVVYPPKPGLFPDKDPFEHTQFQVFYQPALSEGPNEMGLGGGGRIIQKIYPDKYGYDTWDQNHFAKIEIHIVNSLAFRQITGALPPPSPIDFQVYKDLGLPWYEIYDQEQHFINSRDFLLGLPPKA